MYWVFYLFNQIIDKKKYSFNEKIPIEKGNIIS